MGEAVKNMSTRTYSIYDSLEDNVRHRWVFNNIIAIFHVPAPDGGRYTDVPHEDYLDATDINGEQMFQSNGNLWYSNEELPKFSLCISRLKDDEGRTIRCPIGQILTLTALQEVSAYMTAKFELNSIVGDPQFVSVSEDGAPRSDDNFSIKTSSPACGNGKELPPPLRDALPEVPSLDIGARCCFHELHYVGVAGRFMH